MMSRRKEKISAFLDDDLHRDELMSFSLSAELDDAEIARRYQMMGDALRGEISDSSFVDVSHAVREALAGENIADDMPAASINTSVNTSTPQSSSKFDWSPWFRPLAGMAVAASVAVVMVAVLTEQGNNGIAPVATHVDQQVIKVATDHQSVDKKSADSKAMDLDPYINQHLEFATQDTLQGRLPYVRAVGFEPSNRLEAGRFESGRLESGRREKIEK